MKRSKNVVKMPTSVMEKKAKSIEKKTKVANGILRKQTLLTNQNAVKNLNERTKKGATVATPKKGAPVEASRPPLPQGCTPLMYACQQADESLVAKILLKEPTSVTKRDRTLKTALHYCFDNPTASTADRIIMAAPALLEARDQDGFTPLHLAVIQGNMPLLTFLLANSADVMALDNEKHSVVHWATVCGELEALRAVLSAGADPSTADIHGGYPLHYAAQMCGSSSAGSTRLSLEVLGALLRANTPVDVTDGQGRQPLLWAASAGSAPAILALVKAGAAVEASDKDGLTALHCAASRGHTECIETLLTLCGARPDVIDSNGCTALHYAVTLGHADATALLLDHHSDPNRQDRKGRSPAHCGCAKGQLETVRMLGARGANIWLRNAKGDLPLHEAVASGRRELVKWLLEMRPSQINATNNDGRTLLHIAANTDNTDLCKILLDFGAQVNAVLRTSKNILMTPLDCALHKGYRSTAKYLQMHGGLPASRLASRQVLVNQDSIPQLPVRHIKSTKINLRDNIAIEKKEIFEMSPCSTPKHKYSSKGGSLLNSSEYSSEEYEIENKRLREKRRKAKKLSQQYKKGKMDRNSFSDGYESEHLEKHRSSRQHRALSESDDNTYKKDNKRSKSEPSDTGVEKVKKTEVSTSRKNKKVTGKSSESDADKKYKKRRKTLTSQKSSVTSSSGEVRKRKKEEKATKESSKNQEVPKVEAKEVQSNIKVNEIIEKIENNIVKLDDVIESKMLENESSTDALIQTTLITEAQVHAENLESPERFAEERIIEVVREDETVKSEEPESKQEDKNEISKLETRTIEIESQTIITENQLIEAEKQAAVVESQTIAIETQVLENENQAAEQKEEESNKTVVIEEKELQNESGQKDSEREIETNTEEDKKEDGSKELEEHHAEILEEKIESEILGPDLEISPHDGIIAIIPDTDIGDLNIDEDMVMENEEKSARLASQDSESKDEEKPFIQAIMGILPDEKSEKTTKNKETDDSPDSVMGEAVAAEPDFDENKTRAITLVGEEFPTPKGQNVTFSPRRQIHRLSQEDSTDLVNETVKDAEYDDYEEDEDMVRSKSSKEKTWRSESELRRISDPKRREMYETQSYRVLCEKNDQDQDTEDSIQEQARLTGDVDEPDRFVKQAIYTRRRMPSVSDNEIYTIVDSSGIVRRRRLRKKYRVKDRGSAVRSKSQNSDRDYESSFFVDSGFEPSPRVIYQNRIMSPRLAAYYQDRNATGAFADKVIDSKIPKRKPGDRNAVDMASVTQVVQTNMRRYFLERKIFQHLMDLKRIQIRSSKAHEAVLVKRAIDEYNKSSLAYVGSGRYNANEFTYKNFEKFLYDSLRKLQRSSAKYLLNLPERAFPEFEGKIDEVYRMDGLPDNPLLCTSKTHRCFHAVHAYTGIPCSAYIPPKMNHHTMPKPEYKKRAGFLPQINNKTGKKQNGQVTLELCHGSEKQMISLPAEKLDKNKRYYVTFTVKGSNPNSDNENKNSEDTQRNVKSV